MTGFRAVPTAYANSVASAWRGPYSRAGGTTGNRSEAL